MSDAEPFDETEETFGEAGALDGEPESGSPSSSEEYASEEEEEEEDELVDEMEDVEPIETNRRTRRPLRIKLSRSKPPSESTPNSTPSRRSGRRTTRTARARASSGMSDASDDDELAASDDSDELASESMDQPMTARQIARANRERGIQNEELVELPMGASPTHSLPEPTKRQKLSETELALRRSETARRRRNQSEKKLEDDKIEVSKRAAYPDHQSAAQEAGGQSARQGPRRRYARHARSTRKTTRQRATPHVPVYFASGRCAACRAAGAAICRRRRGGRGAVRPCAAHRLWPVR